MIQKKILLCCVALGSVLARAEERPNIVFVFADQMQAQAMGCMGNAEVITPRLDRLASEGLLLTNAISAQPVCTPYRVHLMTGRYGHATGVVHNDIRLPDSELLIPEILQTNGYRTGYIGKWHLSGDRKNPVDGINRRGWDYWAVRNCSHQYFKVEYWVNDSDTSTKAEGWEPDVQTDLAIAFIRENKGHPFSVFLSLGPPHNPYKAPQHYSDMYAGRVLTARPNVPNPDLDRLKEYYAMITSLDTCMGRIDDALKQAGVAENTILIFTADHGDMLGSQGHTLKQRPWEESINIPFILRYTAKIAPGQQRDWIVSSVDVMPTLLGFCRLPIPENVQGMDYSATFLGDATRERDAAFLFNVHAGGGPNTDWRGIRTKEWSYAFHHAGDWVLYNVQDDPYELHNLVDDPTYRDTKAALRNRLDATRLELGESIPLVGKEPAPIVLP